MGELEIRPYRPGDRARVRRICFETGYMGEPVDWLWNDAESFADLFSGYYTDREPESALVIDRGGDAVGYLLGCVDSRRTRGVEEAVIRRLIRRGGLLRPGVALFLWRALFDVLRDRGARRDFPDAARWPAHLHIDLLPEARGQGLGRQLVETWCARLCERGIPGLHLGTFAENRPAIAFFEACGFERCGDPMRAPGFRTREGGRMHSQWLVRSLGGARGVPIFHIARAADWNAGRGSYRVDTLATQGFIHCSEAHQVMEVAERLFGGASDLLLLAIDPGRVRAEIRRENLEGGAELFPHVYGALDRDAVVAVERLRRGPDGRFATPLVLAPHLRGAAL
jgi:uncharacterized protein (DUF952 family)/GNAT superfamily N-acetyltransferase